MQLTLIRETSLAHSSKLYCTTNYNKISTWKYQSIFSFLENWNLGKCGKIWIYLSSPTYFLYCSLFNLNENEMWRCRVNNVPISQWNFYCYTGFGHNSIFSNWLLPDKSYYLQTEHLLIEWGLGLLKIIGLNELTPRKKLSLFAFNLRHLCLIYKKKGSL